MSNEHLIITGPQLSDLISLLKTETLNPTTGNDTGFKSTIPHTSDSSEYRSHVCVSGAFIGEPGTSFVVYVKRESKCESLLTELLQNNIDSFEYQMAVGDLIHMQGVA